MAVYGDKGVVSYLLQFGGNFGPLVGLPTNAIVIFNTGGMGLAATLAGTGAPRAATFGLVGAGFGQSYVLEIGPATGFDNCAVIYLDQITVSEHGSIGLFGVVYSYEYALSNVVILNFADYDSGATGWYTGGADPGGLIYDFGRRQRDFSGEHGQRQHNSQHVYVQMVHHRWAGVGDADARLWW